MCQPATSAVSEEESIRLARYVHTLLSCCEVIKHFDLSVIFKWLMCCYHFRLELADLAIAKMRARKLEEQQAATSSSSTDVNPPPIPPATTGALILQ